MLTDCRILWLIKNHLFHKTIYLASWEQAFFVLAYGKIDKGLFKMKKYSKRLTEPQPQ